MEKTAANKMVVVLQHSNHFYYDEVFQLEEVTQLESYGFVFFKQSIFSPVYLLKETHWTT